jgi:hypothetical protein
MKKIFLIVSVLMMSNLAQAEEFSWNPVKLSGYCLGQRTNIVTPFVGVDPDQSFGVFMRNDGIMGTEDRPFRVRGQSGKIYVSTPDHAFTFSISRNSGVKVSFEFSSRLGMDSQESDEFVCQLELK